jgi:hypothetical protein
MPGDRHDALVSGIASGSWLPKPTNARPRFMSPVVRAQRPRASPIGKEAALSDDESTASWVDSGPEFYGYSVRRIGLVSLGILLSGTLLLLIIMEANGTINLIPPAWSPPPSPPPSPLPPTLPPLPPSPPSPPTPPPPPASPPHAPLVTVLASSTCKHVIGGVVVLLASNGRCEDGGDGSVSSICQLGSDYPDCPERQVVSG